ncbi:hypothetical protein Hsar01_02183 [Haloferula sargassicola]|uniref:Uncharacterized protein n=2 Tax=Haloferula sargassicola TaxID=490096 RepID=A0ABP9UQF6_9BACT
MNRTTASMTADPFRRGEGYLYFVGLLQIGAGLLSLVFSGLGWWRVTAIGAAGLANPVDVVERFSGQGAFSSLVAGFVTFQMMYGWIFGLLLVVSGVLSLKCRAKGFVRASSVANFFNYPHGTTAALMTWHGVGRPGIAAAFRDAEAGRKHGG